MNRPRGKGTKDLPANLYVNKKGYFSYRHPKTGKYHGMGINRTQAILAAKQLNSILTTKTDLVDRVIGRANLFSSWLDEYKSIRIKERLSGKTKKLLKYDIELMREQLGNIPIADLSVFHCAEFIDTWAKAGKLRMAARMRSQLIKCISFAQSQGLIDDNPADKTRPVAVQVQRKRLSKADFDAIYVLASPVIRNAMMLALVTLQRREDVAAMKFKDIVDGSLKVAQIKTAKGRGKRADSTNEAAHLMITVTPQLQEIISRCRNTGVLSPYLIHHTRGRRMKSGVITPGMPLQPDNITRGFQSARDKTKLFEDMPAEERPTFHEIRSLGATLYKAQGVDPQALLGHSDPKMTKHYLDGHGVTWTVVEAGLKV